MLWDFYVSQRGVVKRAACVDELAAHFEQRIYELRDENEDFGERNIGVYSRVLLSRLVEYRWVEEEEGTGFDDVNIIFPNYSRKFLDVILDIENNSDAQYKKLTSSIYASLKTALIDKPAIFTHFTNAYDSVKELRDMLLTMRSQTKKMLSTLLEQAEAEGILSEHDKYVDIIGASYHPLKTDDNIYRYQTEIMSILNELRDNNELLEALALQAFKENVDINEAEYEIISAIDEMQEILLNIDTIINGIDQKHTQYVRTTYNRLSYCLSQNKNFKGNLISVIQAIAKSEDIEPFTATVSTKLPLFTSEFFAESSVFKPYKRKDRGEWEATPVEDEAENQNNVKDGFINEYKAKLASKYTPQTIMKFLNSNMVNGSLNTKDLELRNDEEYVQLIAAYLYCANKKLPVKMKLSDNMVKINSYTIPEVEFTKEAKHAGMRRLETAM